MELKVSIRNVYGTDRIYPADAMTRNVAKRLGVKTFNHDQIEMLKELGHTVVADAQPVQL
jgi:hypothetical protein